MLGVVSSLGLVWEVGVVRSVEVWLAGCGLEGASSSQSVNSCAAEVDDLELLERAGVSQSVDGCAAEMNDRWLQERETCHAMVSMSQQVKRLPFT